MTEKLFYGNGPLEANVIVKDCRELPDGTFAVILDKTPFHPKGGGQPSDIGCIDNIQVKAVVETESGEILHISDAPIELGTKIARVDEASRVLNTRLHSASHLISSFIESRGDWKVIKGNSFPGQARLYFVPKKAGAPVPSVEEISEFLETIVKENLPLKETIDPMTGSRFITWGDLKGYPCGGTHVSSTGKLGLVVLTKFRIKKGELHVNFDVKEE